MAKRLPKKTTAWNFRQLQFEITNDAIYDLVALHILIYDHTQQQALRYVFTHFQVANNLHAITDAQWSDIGDGVGKAIRKYGSLSRNKRKQALKEVISGLKEAN